MQRTYLVLYVRTVGLLCLLRDGMAEADDAG